MESAFGVGPTLDLFGEAAAWTFIMHFSKIILTWWVVSCAQFEGSSSQKMSGSEVERLTELGKQFMAKGQFADALSQFHAAIEGDPANYLLYYRRATVHLAMGRSKSGLEDLNKVLKLKPDFTAARLQRGYIYLKYGELDLAHIDFENVIRLEPDNMEALKGFETVNPLKRDIEEAYHLSDAGHCNDAVGFLSSAIEVCPWDVSLRERRATCFEQLGDYMRAIHDLKPTTKLVSDNTAAYLKISTLYYHMGDAEASLEQIRECLKLDQDHKKCHDHYKKVKKLFQQQKLIDQYIGEQNFDGCVTKAQAALKTEPDLFVYVLRQKSKICHCYSKDQRPDMAVKACTEVLNMDDGNVDAIMDRAEAFILEQRFDEALSDFQKAKQFEDSQRVQEGIQRAQKLMKQAKKKDYYKILGLRRNAKKREILKAYRKLAVQWHPDKYEGEDKKRAEQVFIDIASAKEVLTDPEKRAKFDAGEDPLDPEQQQHGGQGFHFRGSPFGPGFNPFGNQGNFQFKFHFN